MNRNTSFLKLIAPRLILATGVALSVTIALPSLSKEAEKPATDSTTADDNAKQSLEKVLLPAIKQHKGTVGLAVKNLKTGESYAYEGDKPMPTASLIKFPVMIAAYKAVEDGKLSLGTMIELKKEDQVGGSGLLTSHFSPGTKLSLLDAIHLMMVYSDNTATNLVIDQVGLPATNEMMKSLGCDETQLNSKVFRRDTSINPERSKLYGLGSTTANDMIKLAEQVYKHDVVSKDACEKMLGHMFACDDKVKVPKLLPAGTKVAHKTGSVTESRTDAGVMETPAGPIAFAILTDKNQDKRWSDDNEGDAFCAQMGLAIYDYFNSKADASTATTATASSMLQVGSEGELVMALQRTLNARIKPSPGMGVDGDFGPETEGNVKKFQTQAGLEPTGIVDTATWKALGPIVSAEEEEQAPEPAVVNTAKSDKLPLEPLDGPPFVTAKSWAIIDGNSGEFLAGGDEDVKRDPASTTKIMTAYLVTSLAEKDPAVLEEVVTFSERADKTSGSTSDLKAGEKVSVGELLYGLMLPSGNDASVALGEHFGKRLSPEFAAKNPKATSYDCFIDAMNRKAAEIGMKSSHYANTHGLTADGHQLTARDLAHLAFLAFKQPEFRKRVGTVQHGATVDSEAGYQRNVLWKNTNQLLKTQGYDGIKTGTTGAAGACLVSTGERDGRRLIIVILGSTSTESRYVDARNLYRWAWKDLLKLQDHGNDNKKSAAK